MPYAREKRPTGDQLWFTHSDKNNILKEVKLTYAFGRIMLELQSTPGKYNELSKKMLTEDLRSLTVNKFDEAFELMYNAEPAMLLTFLKKLFETAANIEPDIAAITSEIETFIDSVVDRSIAEQLENKALIESYGLDDITAFFFSPSESLPASSVSSPFFPSQPPKDEPNAFTGNKPANN